MKVLKKSITLVISATVFLSYTSCITKQTTRQDDVIVDEKYIIKRPVKNFFETVELE